MQLDSNSLEVPESRWAPLLCSAWCRWGSKKLGSCCLLLGWRPTKNGMNHFDGVICLKQQRLQALHRFSYRETFLQRNAPRLLQYITIKRYFPCLWLSTISHSFLCDVPNLSKPSRTWRSWTESLFSATKYWIGHFTVVCSVIWPLNGSKAEGDLVLIQTSLLLLCKSNSYAN